MTALTVCLLIFGAVVIPALSGCIGVLVGMLITWSMFEAMEEDGGDDEGEGSDADYLSEATHYSRKAASHGPD